MKPQAFLETSTFKPFESTSTKNNKHVYLYYCWLCDEVLAFSRHLVDPLKIRLVFDETCPGCGFELERVLSCEALELPDATGILTCTELGKIERSTSLQVGGNGGNIPPRNSFSKITTGIESVDEKLGFGQLTVLRGTGSHELSLLLCVRAVLPKPLGPDSCVVFIDGGNMFDTRSISSQAIAHRIGVEKAHGRIHLSRAFTYHQVSALITQKLSRAVDRFHARLVVVSDITQLYCDPDVKDVKDARDTFARDVSFLRDLAERKDVLAVATALKPRDFNMDSFLLQTAHTSIGFQEKKED